MGVDFRGVGAKYVGPKLHADVPGRQVDNWGIHRRWIEHESGGYWDYCDFPLREATVEMVAEWPMPSPDDYDYSEVAETCRRYQQYAINGAAGLRHYQRQRHVAHMEQTFIDLITGDPRACCWPIGGGDSIEVTARCWRRPRRAWISLVGEDWARRSPFHQMQVFREQIHAL